MKGSDSTRKKPAGRIFLDVIKTVATLAAALLLCEGLYYLGVGEQNLSIVMVLAVFVIAAATPGYWYGLAATVVGVLAYDYLVTEPRLGFSITQGFPITLSICKSIIEAHGGWIEAANGPAGGARFTFGLPMEKERGDEE